MKHTIHKAHVHTILRRARAYVKEMGRVADVRIKLYHAGSRIAIVGCCARDSQPSFKMKLAWDNGIGWFVSCDDY